MRKIFYAKALGVVILGVVIGVVILYCMELRLYGVGGKLLKAVQSFYMDS